MKNKSEANRRLFVSNIFSIFSVISHLLWQKQSMNVSVRVAELISNHGKVSKRSTLPGFLLNGGFARAVYSMASNLSLTIPLFLMTFNDSLGSGKKLVPSNLDLKYRDGISTIPYILHH